MNESRIRLLNDKNEVNGKCIVYWMSRDQRIEDNWAFEYAQNLALNFRMPLVVVFCLANHFLGATSRQFQFMLDGLVEVEKELEQLNIGFVLLNGEPVVQISRFVIEQNAKSLICDFSPMHIGRQWRESVARQINLPFYEVDAHNIIPAWILSSKQEYAAYTLRPKIYKLLPEYLEPYVGISKHPFKGKSFPQTNWKMVKDSLKLNSVSTSVSWLKAGAVAANNSWDSFKENGLNSYIAKRNLPDQDGQSNLSPFLHYGHLSALRVVLDLNEYCFKYFGKPVTDFLVGQSKVQIGTESISAFFEELVVRRELADNFCFYNKDYDSFAGFPVWAKMTLTEHANDPREWIYTYEQFESGQTHDDLWNASQLEMVKRGKTHGYMRMYWAKKILEWTESPEQAMEIAMKLNDKYELDGRDPNGYAGIAWAIGGVHDRPWFERPVFGKIRYMSYGGCKSKFDVKRYIKKVNEL